MIALKRLLDLMEQLRSISFGDSVFDASIALVGSKPAHQSVECLSDFLARIARPR
jgi:hypothetical protein